MEEKEKVNLIMPDTNVLINDPTNCLERFINGGNKVVIPLTVLSELDNLKSDPRIGMDVREVIRQIEKFGFGKNELFEIEKNTDFKDIDLDFNKADNLIMATFNHVIKNKKYAGYNTYKLVSNDVSLRIIAHSLFKDNPKVSIELYKKEQIEKVNVHKEIPSITLKNFPVDYAVKYDQEIHGVLNQNAGIIISYENNKAKEKESLFVRKGNYLQLIKNDFELFGLKAFSDNNTINYGQLLAFHHLSSPDVNCVFLEGQAGSGKTLIALAAGLAQKNKYEQFIIANPMVPLSNKSNMGFLPGDIYEKTAPWLVPFEQNLRFLEKYSASEMYKLVNPNNKRVRTDQAEQSLRTKYSLIPQPLEYIRGQTIADAFIIIEESQNLSQHEIKTIITRLGKNSKIVFCGDLSQIDIPYLTENSSGLTYATEKMVGTEDDNKMIASVMLSKSVRSKLAAFASSVL